MTEIEVVREWLTPALMFGMLAFLWKISADVAVLRERMAQLEGMFEGFTDRRESKES
ncbi:MAG: hypothetical protein OXC63_01510 [Aestuariivita sp.]|nr:hypothetical protein [Aestuariivita sp.]MCY4348171.1 hypothetical protein [Aestuariivita sp.]